MSNLTQARVSFIPRLLEEHVTLPWVSRQSGDRTSNVTAGLVAHIRTVTNLSRLVSEA